jgi:hypothetical protein
MDTVSLKRGAAHDAQEEQFCLRGSFLDSSSSSESSAKTKPLTQLKQGTKKKSSGCPRKNIKYRLCHSAHKAVIAVSAATTHHVRVDIIAASTAIVKKRGT